MRRSSLFVMVLAMAGGLTAQETAPAATPAWERSLAAGLNLTQASFDNRQGGFGGSGSRIWPSASSTR
jgi:hypothetical protein